MPTTRRARWPMAPSTAAGAEPKYSSAAWPGSPSSPASSSRNSSCARSGATASSARRIAALRALLEQHRDSRHVGDDHRVVRIKAREQSAGQATGLRLGWHTVVDPVLLAEPLQQAAIVEQLQVSRHARLALAEHLGQLGHGELAVREDGEQPQPGRLGYGAEVGQEAIERSLIVYKYNDVFIVFASPCLAVEKQRSRSSLVVRVDHGAARPVQRPPMTGWPRDPLAASLARSG